MITKEKALEWINREIHYLERAPEINGCEMTEDWKETLEVMKFAKEAIENV